MTLAEQWGILLGLGISEESLQLVTDINGYSTDVLEDILYATHGYRSFDQLGKD